MHSGNCVDENKKKLQRAEQRKIPLMRIKSTSLINLLKEHEINKNRELMSENVFGGTRYPQRLNAVPLHLEKQRDF